MTFKLFSIIKYQKYQNLRTRISATATCLSNGKAGRAGRIHCVKSAAKSATAIWSASTSSMNWSPGKTSRADCGRRLTICKKHRHKTD